MWTTTTTNDKVSDHRDSESFLNELIDEVVSSSGIDKQKIFTHNRQKNIKYSRWMVWEIMYFVWNYTLAECGAIFGTFDHSTVSNGLDKLPFDLEQSEYLNLIYTTILKKLKVSEHMITEGRKKRDIKRGTITPKALKAKQRLSKRINLTPSRKAI